MTTDIAALEARLRRLEDIEEIRRLRMRYHDFINQQKFDQIAQLFTDDASLDFGYVAQAKGMAEIHELFVRMPSNLSMIKQFIHNHIVDVDGDVATGTSYLDARYAQDGESVMVASRFLETYKRLADGWKISTFQVEIYFSVPINKGWAGEQTNYVKPFR